MKAILFIKKIMNTTCQNELKSLNYTTTCTFKQCPGHQTYLVCSLPTFLVVLEHSLPQHAHYFRKMFICESVLCNFSTGCTMWTPGIIICCFSDFGLHFRVVHHHIGAKDKIRSEAETNVTENLRLGNIFKTEALLKLQFVITPIQMWQECATGFLFKSACNEKILPGKYRFFFFLHLLPDVCGTLVSYL